MNLEEPGSMVLYNMASHAKNSAVGHLYLQHPDILSVYINTIQKICHRIWDYMSILSPSTNKAQSSVFGNAIDLATSGAGVISPSPKTWVPHPSIRSPPSGSPN